MLGVWLDQPIWLMFVILALGFGAIVALILALSSYPHARKYTGVAPSYFSAVAVLLALLLGFVANETWDRQRQAGRVVQSESDNVLAVYDLSVAAASDTSKIRAALQSYVAAVVTEEWSEMADSRSSPRAAEALGALLQEVAQPRIAAEAGGPTQAALLASVLKIGGDRGERLALNTHNLDDTKWLALLILGVLTQISIGIVHLERPRAQFAALLIFTTGLVSTLGLVAIHEWPFDGPAAIKPEALTLALAHIREGPAVAP